MYIPKDKLIGVGLVLGNIRFYHIYKRSMEFEFKAGYENFHFFALQYLPKRKIMWSFLDRFNEGFYSYFETLEKEIKLDKVLLLLRNHQSLSKLKLSIDYLHIISNKTLDTLSATLRELKNLIVLSLSLTRRT